MDKIDFTDVVGGAKNFSLSLPRSRPHRIMLMKRIAESIQRRQGHFFFDQIYEILERAYPEVADKQGEVIQGIEHWVDNDEEVEFLGEEGGFCVYRMH